MLVFSRGANESTVITVPPSDEATVVRVMCITTNRKQARLGFSADRRVTIHRAEVQRKIEAQPRKEPI